MRKKEKIKQKLFVIGVFCWEFLYFFALVIICLKASRREKKIDIGIGPEPLINNIYHKKALEKQGFKCETYVDTTWHIISEFDKNFSSKSKIKGYMNALLNPMFIYAIRTYKILYIYFNGGPLYKTRILWRIEPWLLKIANVKVVVMPYGGDVQCLNRTRNLYFKACMISDYPNTYRRNKRVEKQIDLWTQSNAYIISGCDWVEYTYHWDKLMISHFSIDIDKLNKLSKKIKETSKLEKKENKRPLRVLHAPNHRRLKGTSYIIEAIEQLQKEGLNIDLKLLEKVDNEKVLNEIVQADLVIDQLVIGWYAMFAIEAMCLNKPVICYLRSDIKELYIKAGLLAENEIPIINANVMNIRNKIEELYYNREILSIAGKKGNKYVTNKHSLESIGSIFSEINMLLLNK